MAMNKWEKLGIAWLVTILPAFIIGISIAMRSYELIIALGVIIVVLGPFAYFAWRDVRD